MAPWVRDHVTAVALVTAVTCVHPLAWKLLHAVGLAKNMLKNYNVKGKSP